MPSISGSSALFLESQIHCLAPLLHIASYPRFQAYAGIVRSVTYPFLGALALRMMNSLDTPVSFQLLCAVPQVESHTVCLREVHG